MELDSIIDMLRQTLAASPTSFEAAANWSADRMPESWIVACLMQACQEVGIAAMPEVRARHDLERFESGGKVITLENVPALKAGAKIDLFLGEQSSLPGKLRLRVAMEIKGPKSPWEQFHLDIERLRHFRSVISSKDQAVIFAYVSCPLLETEREEDARKLVQHTRMKLSQFRVSSARQSTDGARRARVYMHIIHGTK